jgi:hypothetical protein
MSVAPHKIWAFFDGPMVGLFVGKEERGTNVAGYVREDLDGWQDIATAPKDGTEILTFSPANDKAMFPVNRKPRMVINKWCVGAWWRTSAEAMPTHWMPLPAPPERKD